MFAATPKTTLLRCQAHLTKFQRIHVAAKHKQRRNLFYKRCSAKPHQRIASFSTNMKDTKEPHHTTNVVEDSWKYEAPYRSYEQGEGFDANDVKHEAYCHCGRVQYQLNRETPLDSKLCHCKDCQVQHGAPFQWAAIFHKEDIHFVSGHTDLEWYNPESKREEHTLPCKVRCKHCKSPIMDEGRRMILLFPSLIRFTSEQAKAIFKPKLHMFYSARVMDIPDGLPKWSGMANSSALMEE